MSTQGVISTSKIAKIIDNRFNESSRLDKDRVKKQIDDTLELMPTFPEEPSVDASEDDMAAFKELKKAFSKNLRDRYTHIRKLEREIREKNKLLEKKTETMSDVDKKENKKSINNMTSELKSLNSHYDEQENGKNIKKFEDKIFSYFDERKNFGKENVRFGKKIQHIISMLLDNVLDEIFRSGISKTGEAGLKTLYNKHLFSNHIKELNLYPLYSGLETIKRYIDCSDKERRNEVIKTKHRSDLNSYNKNKDKTKTKKPKPTVPHFNLIDYSIGNISSVDFGTSLHKFYTNVKGNENSDYRFSGESKNALSVFCCEFVINLIDVLKKMIDMETKVTFKPIHVMKLLTILSTYHNIDMGGLLKHIQTIIDTKPKPKINEDDDDDLEETEEL